MSLINNTSGVYWNNGTALPDMEYYYCYSYGERCHNANLNGNCTLTACTKINGNPIIYEKLDNGSDSYKMNMIYEENKVIEYTSRWKDFQFRSPTYLGDSHVDEHVFDLVKWKDDTCWSVGRLVWTKDEYFEFKSVGMRYLEYYIEGLNEWVMAFAKMKEIELRSKDD